jgi:hypothetical protein
MSESGDPIPEIVASGREVVAEDVGPLWSDLMEGRSTARQAAMWARMLMDTANAAHVASWGLSSLHAVTLRGVPAAEDVSVAHERWRRHVREYQADPDAWDRSYYRRMIIDFTKRHGTERARAGVWPQACRVGRTARRRRGRRAGPGPGYRVVQLIGTSRCLPGRSRSPGGTWRLRTCPPSPVSWRRGIRCERAAGSD